MAKIWVIKHDGSRQPFSQEKALNSILRAGVDKKQAGEILGIVESKLYSGITTKEIYKLVHSAIRGRVSLLQANFFRVREGLARMGSFDFEKLVARVLESRGFSCQWNVMVGGRCIEHQIDVMAERGAKKYLVEVKHHRSEHRDCGLGDVVEMWGRLRDIEEGEQITEISGACLVTNTKFSQHACRFASCRGILLLGWRYNSFDRVDGPEEGLEKILEQVGREKVAEMVGKLLDDKNGKEVSESV